ncbi:MAG: hypothetical protein EPN85_11515 [Bacteroidetes bacterium]|nr:MAG: hypothetical protein EPN85_11515 [Bacteroidota bacterium]
MKKTIFQIVIVTTIILPAGNSFSQDPAQFKPSGKVWGYVFGDYYYKVHSDSMDRGIGEYSKLKENTNAFELRRVYFGYDYSISEKFSAELLLSNEKNYDASSNRTVFIKAANVRWKNFIPKNDLIIGQSSTPAWSFVSEKVWGYRSVEKTITDMHKAGNANDLGVALQGKPDSVGNIGYNFMIGNGTGSKIENDVFKKVYGEVYFKFLNKKLILDLYGDYELTHAKPYRKSKMTNKLFLAYQAEKLTVGVELLKQKQENYTTYTDSVLGQSSQVDVSLFSAAVFVRGNILKDKLSFFFRADVYDPDSEYNADYVYSGSYSAYHTEIFSVFGLDFTPNKNVHFIPNIWYASYQSRLKNASGKMKLDYDLVPRFTFHYLFK